MKSLISTLVLLTAVSGCATYEPLVPANFSGPTATIADHGHIEDNTKGQLFYLESVDGKAVESSRIATRRASEGKGFSLTLAFKEHRVPARPLKLKIVATHVTAAPIHEIASRTIGTFFSVEGEITFTPLPGRVYFVNGKLAKSGSSVWIADSAAENVPVSEVITAP